MSTPDKSATSRFKKDYWSYYLSLEDKLINVFRYIEPTKQLFTCYSRELHGLLQAIGSEIDVCGKSLAELYSPTIAIDKADIRKWGYLIGSNTPSAQVISIHSELLDLTLEPWKTLKCEERQNKKGEKYYRYLQENGKQLGSSPEFWKAYNATKHRRKSILNPTQSSYERANLGNAIEALGGLYVLEELLKSKIEHDAGEQISLDASRLFVIYQPQSSLTSDIANDTPQMKAKIV